MTILAGLLNSLPLLRNNHERGSVVYNFLADVARKEAEANFAKGAKGSVDFGPFGTLNFPYHKFGAIDSISLFDLDELIIFAFYWANRARYKKAADIGANIGLHSIMLNKSGYEVQSFEPDPVHFELLNRNLGLNNCKGVHPHNAAVSNQAGSLEFIRVVGNTTGSHIAGAKENPYGELERFQVETMPIGPIMEWADLVKLDAEGHEKEILLATTAKDWEKTDMLVEIQNAANAKLVYEHLKKLGVNMYSQKINWKRASSLSDIPEGYKEGTLFISPQETMLWE